MDGNAAGGYTNQFFDRLVRLWLIHLSIILLTATVLCWFGKVFCYSVISGGLIFLIPNIYLAVCVFRHDIESADGVKVVGNFYKGEVGKFILSFVCFAVVFALAIPINWLMLFATYAVLTLVHWLAVVRLEF